MKNLFRMLALTLAISLMLSFSVFAFTDDASIGINYVDDVNMLVQLGVINGYPDGSFGPQNHITRAEFAKMAYTLKYGSDSDGNLFAGQPSVFADVANDYWAVGYINYCANQKIVSGVSANKFNPNSNITVAEATKMILVIMGCDPVKEGFVGKNWAANVVAKAIDLGVFDGWTGNPTSYATRELVAKLMKNAIFSPVYKYSAITGTGSQYNALATDYNETLGEEVMGLKTVEGIVVANERYTINTDEKGEELKINIPTAKEDESVIYYEAKELNGDINGYTITIDRALPDEMLGNKVNVYFRADTNSKAKFDYKNVEVIGDVLVNSDTVVYDVPASIIKIYPNNESNSSTEIQPYLTFTVNGEEIVVETDRKEVNKVAKKENAKESDDVKKYFADLGYEFKRIDSRSYLGDLVKGSADTFINEMGEGYLVDYRFVSVDGGNTISYVFKSTEAKFGTITSMNGSTIRVSGFGTIDEEDAIVDGVLNVDDFVICSYIDGKIAIDAVASVYGAVENYGENSIIVNGNEYKAWNGCEQVNNGDIIAYLMDNKRIANDEDTCYYVYNNLILEIDADTSVGSAENYAVILKSVYDEDLDVARVRLGFADNTEGMYEVSKTYLENRSNPYAPENEGNMAKDFADNRYAGYVVEYKLTSGGVDLSAQDMNDIKTFVKKNEGEEDTVITPAVVDNKFAGYYAYDSASVLFVITEKNGMIDHRAYKLAEVENLSDLVAGFGSYVVNNYGVSDYVVAAAVKSNAEKVVIDYEESRDVAYVTKATQRYNTNTDLYYLDLEMIAADGKIVASTIEDVEDFSGNNMLDNTLGRVKNYEGKLVKYEISDDIITKFEIVSDSDYEAITIVEVKNNKFIGYYAFNKDVDITAGTELQTVRFSEDGYTVIGIDEEDYIGDTISKHSTKEDVKANTYNAFVLYDKDKNVKTIFSFANN